MKFKLIVTGLFFCSAQLIAQRINKDKIVDHISFLASDALNGRGTGTEDERKAAKYIAGQFDAMGLKSKGNNGFYYDFYYTHSPKNPHGDVQSNEIQKKSRDVVAFLDNGAPTTIIIGAHYDHLGLGFDHNSLAENPETKIHNGADDNASGVAGVIELARYFSLNGITEKHNFLFITFSGEELGLIGSKKWCEKPSIPLASVDFMINMDMIGRLNDTTKKLLIYGVGTSSEWIPTINSLKTDFSLKLDSAGVGPSDHTSFYYQDIPVLHFFTGQHSDYHKPTDDMDKVNYVGESKVLEYIVDLLYAMDEKPKLKFLKTKTEESTKMSFKVTLGIMPDYTLMARVFALMA